MEWYRIESYGLEWCRIELYGKEWNNMIYDIWYIISYGMILNRMI